MMNARLLLAIALSLTVPSLPAADVDVVPAASVGMSPTRLAALTDRLQEEIDNEVTGDM